MEGALYKLKDLKKQILTKNRPNMSISKLIKGEQFLNYEAR